MDETQEILKTLNERFAQLPQVVQDAITSADVQKRLRALAETEKLHLDQWEELEHIVQMTLLGLESSEDLKKNIEKEVGVTPEIAATLAENVIKVVFEPIREELERQLEHPSAQQAVVSDIDTARDNALARKEPATTAPPTPTAPSVEPGTPPSPAPAVTIARAPASGAYKPGEASTVRKSVVDDPYREPVA